MDKDPNVMLTRIRSIVAKLDRDGTATASAPLRDLVEGVTDLDRCLSAGEAPPADWDDAFRIRVHRTNESYPGDLFRPR